MFFEDEIKQELDGILTKMTQLSYKRKILEKKTTENNNLFDYGKYENLKEDFYKLKKNMSL